MKALFLALFLPLAAVAAESNSALRVTLKQIQERAHRIEERAAAAEADRAEALEQIQAAGKANAELTERVGAVEKQVGELREWGIAEQAARIEAEAKVDKLTKERDEARAHVRRIKLFLAAMATAAAGLLAFQLLAKSGPYGWAIAAGIGLAAGGAVMVFV